MLGAFFRKFLADDGGSDAERERALQLARDALDRKRYDEAIAQLDRLLARRPRGAEALFLRGTALLESGKPKEALADFERAVAVGPPQARFHYNAAAAHWKLDHAGGSQKSLAAALALDPAFGLARDFLAAIEIEGEHYGKLLERIHRHLRPRTYLEIGTDKGDSLALAGPDTIAIGVDPKPEISVVLAANHRVHAQTSDEFFARNDVRALLQGPIALAFIDGMHLFDYALRDFVNIERLCTKDSTILVHDVYPRDRLTAERERRDVFWSGDVWRLVLCLKKYRPELWIHTVAAPPTGLAIIRNLDPASRTLAENLEHLYAEFLAIDYSSIENEKRAALNWFPNDWNEVRQLLDAKPA